MMVMMSLGGWKKEEEEKKKKRKKTMDSMGVWNKCRSGREESIKNVMVKKKKKKDPLNYYTSMGFY